MNYVDFVEEARDRVAVHRSILLMLSRKGSIRIIEEATEDAKIRLMKFIRDMDREAVKFWLQSNNKTELGEKTVRELRPLAKRLGVKNVSTKVKYELIRSIKNEEKRNATTDETSN